MTQCSESNVQPIRWENGELYLLDQRALPDREEYLHIASLEEAAKAISTMVVRGAPAIGVTAAYAVAIAARARFTKQPSDWRQRLDQDMKALADARPTAVNLRWAIDRMRVRLDSVADDPWRPLAEEAETIHSEDIEANLTMGRLGAEYLRQDSQVLTHCNAGALATGGYGTALGVIRSGYAMGRVARVFADETRPWLQGARLTAWELDQEGIPVTLIPDSAAAHLMNKGAFDWVIVGSDRIVANGDVANKIGTYSLAVNARHHGVRFMVVAPTSTIDLNTQTGADIPIECRDPSEVLTIGGLGLAPAGVSAHNPVFDVTPADLVDVIVTEKGVVERPDREGIASLFDE